MGQQDFKIQKVLSIISAFMLLGTLANNPYSYYVLLRWIVCITAIRSAISFKELNNEGWNITFLLISFLFNPLIPVHLNKQFWMVLDLLTAGIFLFSLLRLKSSHKSFLS